jgi:ABC-type antimicrobial peptide transport system permease subunit
VAAVDPNVAIYHLSTAREKVSDLMANFTLVGQVLLGMAALGLVLAAVGIYGVIASLTEQRTREIGIRAALGARRSEVLWLVMRTGLLLSAGGCAIGLCLSAALARLLSRVMPEIPGGGPAPTLAMALLITVVALAACWLPARRAANVDPIEALRCE